MTNLLRADKLKLLKSRKLWVVLGLFAFIPIFQVVNSWVETQHGVVLAPIKDLVINGASGVLGVAKNSEVVLFILAALVSFFINEEFQQGTIRNALSIGRSRSSFYFAKGVTLAVVTLVACLLLTFFEIICFTIFFGFGSMDGIDHYFLYAVNTFLTIYLLILANIAVFVMISFITKNIGVSLIWNWLYILGIIFAPSLLQRSAATQFLLDWITGTFLFYTSFTQPAEIARFPWMILVSLLTIVVSSGIGIFFFKRSDIK
ncbi:ABC transporter permease [Enterococcus xiangfangensis]|uniref:ABC transporter permease n=1 Tax=Enterococcus xiangfangensis TaxID=1296537 RepID=A0ABU3FAR5_9ENTE|nr:ABC transporter permease [Enterococcus xiangfangensis]MDT2759762.1 ABC transporter permease [Enterococcus xiangfangensis]